MSVDLQRVFEDLEKAKAYVAANGSTEANLHFLETTEALTLADITKALGGVDKLEQAIDLATQKGLV